jgi:hypothetical protein
MKSNTLQFMKFSKTLTENVIGNSLKEVFGSKSIALNDLVFPLLSFKDEKKRTFHFIYTELDYLDFPKNGDLYGIPSNISELIFYHQDNPIVAPKSWFAKYMSIVTVNLPFFSDNEETWDASEEEIIRVKNSSVYPESKRQFLYEIVLNRHLKSIDSELMFSCSLGGEPLWVQYSEYPNDRNGEPMEFIAHVSAEKFTDDAADLNFYLFYSEKENRVVQIMQNS